MAYKDMPQIDNPSKNSDLSSVRLRNYLNQSNGFIAREDVPDKGCDLVAGYNSCNLCAFKYTELCEYTK